MAKMKYTNDTISDMLTRLRNAIQSNKASVSLPNVKIILEVLKVMSNAGFIEGYSINENEEIEVGLKVDGKYKINELNRISKPGVRRYVAVNKIKSVKYGKGIAIISTSKGVLSDSQAKEQRCGGELLCEIW